MIKLSDRLRSCAELVKPGNIAADVGTDHGYLALYLLEQNICPAVFASDLREGPLNAARRSAAREGVSDRITFVRSDGLQALPLSEIHTVICAGMGGDTIQGILSAAPGVRDPGKQLILQPQSKAPELRKWLLQNGFSVLRERLSRDGKFLYTAMEVRFTGEEKLLSPGQAVLPPWLAGSGDPLLPAYIARVRMGAAQTVSGLRRAKQTNQALLAEYEEIDAYLLEMEAHYASSK